MKTTLKEYLGELKEIEFIIRDNLLDLSPRLIDEKNRDLAYVLMYDLSEMAEKIAKWQERIKLKYND